MGKRWLVLGLTALLCAGCLTGCGTDSRLQAVAAYAAGLEEELAESERERAALEARVAELEGAQGSLGWGEEELPNVAADTYIPPLPEGALMPVEDAGLLAGSWLTPPPEAGPGWVYQFRFGEGGETMLMISHGLYGSGAGGFYRGEFSMAAPGELEALLTKSTMEESEEHPPVRLQFTAQQAAEAPDVCIFTITAIETEDAEFRTLFEPAVAVPLALERYN